MACNCSWCDPYDPLYFCGVDCNFPFFISDFIYLGPLYCFLVNLAKVLSILFIFLKSQLLVVLIFAIVFFVSISFYFHSDLYDFFPSANYGFCLFFFL